MNNKYRVRKKKKIKMTQILKRKKMKKKILMKIMKNINLLKILIFQRKIINKKVYFNLNLKNLYNNRKLCFLN